MSAPIDKAAYSVRSNDHASADFYEFFHSSNAESLPDFSVIVNAETGEAVIETHCDLSHAEIAAAFLPASKLGGPDEDDYWSIELAPSDLAWLGSVVDAD